jgi:glycine cleavage system H lipoate-binding protein
MTNEKTTDSKNQIWFQKEGNLVKVGFTANFLESLSECWHILPASTGLIREKDPLMAVETNDALLSIRSPAEGVVLNFNNKAMNFPDKLGAEDIILMINTDTKEKVATPSTSRRSNEGGGLLDEPRLRLRNPPQPRQGIEETFTWNTPVTDGITNDLANGGARPMPRANTNFQAFVPIDEPPTPRAPRNPLAGTGVAGIVTDAHRQAVRDLEQRQQQQRLERAMQEINERVAARAATTRPPRGR